METYRLRVFYEKSGAAVFISGRNMLKIIERTFRRTGAPLKFTEGFSPHPKISFGHPLPLNVSGSNESFDVFLCEKIDPAEVIGKTPDVLPEGIVFRKARWMDRSAPSINGSETFAKYTVETEGTIDTETLEKYGRILSTEKNRIEILIKINNFSHKGLTEMLLGGAVKKISREILNEDAISTFDKQ